MLNGHRSRIAITRALLLSVPIEVLAFIPMDLVHGAKRTWSLWISRIVLIGTYSVAAMAVPRMSGRVTRIVFAALAVCTTAMLALLCFGTGGAQSPATSYFWSMPLLMGMLFLHEPLAPLLSGVAALPFAAWVTQGDGKTAVEHTYLLVLIAVSTVLATAFSWMHRRLRDSQAAEERARESDLAQVRAALAHQDRIASLGLLAASVSHELNNPLACVVANLSYALEQVGEGEVRQALSDAREASDRIGKLVSDLRSFARADDAEVSTCALERAVDSALTLAAGQVRGRAQVTVRLATTPPVVGGEAQIGQVLLNLVVNAAQAIPCEREGGGHIVVASRVDESGRVVLEVMDDGSGIAPEVMPRLFEPFVTTKPAGLGTGLGLFVCRSTLRRLGGEIEVESKPGAGTTFRVYLPVADALAKGTPTVAA